MDSALNWARNPCLGRIVSRACCGLSACFNWRFHKSWGNPQIICHGWAWLSIETAMVYHGDSGIPHLRTPVWICVDDSPSLLGVPTFERPTGDRIRWVNLSKVELLAGSDKCWAGGLKFETSLSCVLDFWMITPHNDTLRWVPGNGWSMMV